LLSYFTFLLHFSLPWTKHGKTRHLTPEETKTTVLAFQQTCATLIHRPADSTVD